MSVAIPHVSVVIPLYNKRATVERALRSVLAQAIQDFEIIVVNDGSTDGSADLVRGINDPRIRLIEQTNAGVSAARNRGIAEAKSDLVAFLDADDEWLPGFLRRIADLEAQFPRCGVLACLYSIEDVGGRRRLPILNGIQSDERDVLMQDYFAIASRSDPPIWSSAVAVRKDAITGIGGFPTGIKSGEDLLTWARLAVTSAIALSREPLAVFHQDAATADGTPSRVPDSEDRVGKALHALLERVKPAQRASLSRYLGLWHKMRASIYLRLGCRRQALSECFMALRGMPCEPRLYVYLIACLLPSCIARWGSRRLTLRRG